ncbi:MAG: VanW family protein [Lachnospiraceae bacterium]|nr:VanW family protein [Lachnospiraceae bacterium]
MKELIGKYKYWLIGAAAVLILALVLILVLSGKKEEAFVNFRQAGPEFTGYADDEMIPEGVYIGSIYVGGYSKGQARQMISQVYSTVENREVTIYWDGEPVTTSLEAFNVHWGIEEALNEAIRIGKSHGTLSSYFATMDLKMGTFRMELAKTVDRDKIVSFVEMTADAKDVKAKNAKIVLNDDGEFEVTEGRSGSKTDQAATVAKIVNTFINTDPEATLTVIAAVDVVEPKIKAEELRNIQTILGQAFTIYHDPQNEYGSRAHNVDVATAFINGTVLMPGEQVSTSDLMKDRIEENGYQSGSQMYNGQMEDAIGGGVCQVASTLYNALLKAEIQIDKRSNHSMIVPYIDPSKDAAIATGSKDLIFTNNLDYPIYIKGETDGEHVIFTIYGKETRPANRRVEYESIEDSRVVSEIETVYDDTLDEGTVKYSGSQHDEIYSHLDKVVYIDDVEVSRETINNDHYQLSIMKEIIGTKPTEAAPENTE